MKRIVITQSEAVQIDEIINDYEFTEEDIENQNAENHFFECDPDYFNWGIKDHLHKIPFVKVLDKYIIVPDDYMIEAISDYKLKGLSDKCKEMLIRFFDNNFNDYFISVESSWRNFDGLNFGIAYRGGEGYSYSIWRYQNKNK